MEAEKEHEELVKKRDSLKSKVSTIALEHEEEKLRLKPLRSLDSEQKSSLRRLEESREFLERRRAALVELLREEKESVDVTVEQASMTTKLTKERDFLRDSQLKNKELLRKEIEEWEEMRTTYDEIMLQLSENLKSEEEEAEKLEKIRKCLRVQIDEGRESVDVMAVKLEKERKIVASAERELEEFRQSNEAEVLFSIKKLWLKWNEALRQSEEVTTKKEFATPGEGPDPDDLRRIYDDIKEKTSNGIVT